MILYDSAGYSFIFRLDGSTLPKAAIFATPSAVICLVSSFCQRTAETPGQGDMHPIMSYLNPGAAAVGFVWTVTFFTLSFLIGFRCNKAYARFWDGCTLVQTMSAEWFESCSNLIAFSGMAIKRSPEDLFVERKVKTFQFTLVRLMSLLHGVALRQIGGRDGEEFQVLDLYGLDEGTREYLTCDCAQFEINTAEVVLHWIQVLITESIDNGVSVVPAPILTRAFQTLSRGMVNLHRVRMIADIPFPFPLSQALVILLVIQCTLTPLIISSMIHHYVWAALVSFLPMMGMWSLMFICNELEQPFGQDANDLPLTMQQFDFNNSLLMLVDTFANAVPVLREDAPIDADELRDMFGDEASTTKALHRSEKRFVHTFRDFLRDNKQKREKECAANVNQAMTMLKGDLDTEDWDVHSPTSPKTKRQKFGKTKIRSKDIRAASREGSRSGSRTFSDTAGTPAHCTSRPFSWNKAEEIVSPGRLSSKADEISSPGLFSKATSPFDFPVVEVKNAAAVPDDLHSVASSTLEMQDCQADAKLVASVGRHHMLEGIREVYSCSSYASSPEPDPAPDLEASRPPAPDLVAHKPIEMEACFSQALPSDEHPPVLPVPQKGAMHWLEEPKRVPTDPIMVASTADSTQDLEECRAPDGDEHVSVHVISSGHQARPGGLLPPGSSKRKWGAFGRSSTSVRP